MNENDLDLLLGNIDEILEDNLESVNNVTNINLLDNKENELELNVVTPETLLNEYTDYDLKNEEIKAQIEEIKLENPDIFNKIKELEDKIVINQNSQNEIKNKMKQALIDHKLQNVKNDFWTVSYVAAYTKATFNREAFEKKYPVLAKQFTKYTEVSDGTRWIARK